METELRNIGGKRVVVRVSPGEQFTDKKWLISWRVDALLTVDEGDLENVMRDAHAAARKLSPGVGGTGSIEVI